MTDADLDSLEKLLSGATPAPWRARGDEYGFSLDGPGLHAINYGHEGEMSGADAALCAALRNLAPALVAEVRESRKRLARARAGLTWAHWTRDDGAHCIDTEQGWNTEDCPLCSTGEPLE